MPTLIHRGLDRRFGLCVTNTTVETAVNSTSIIIFLFFKKVLRYLY